VATGGLPAALPGRRRAHARAAERRQLGPAPRPLGRTGRGAGRARAVPRGPHSELVPEVPEVPLVPALIALQAPWVVTPTESSKAASMVVSSGGRLPSASVDTVIDALVT